MEVMRDMATDVESPWDDLLSDIRIHQLNLKQGIGACWEEAIAVLGLFPSRSLIGCSNSNIRYPRRIGVALS